MQPHWRRQKMKGCEVNATISLVAILIGSAVVLIATIILYNRLVRSRLLVLEGFSGIDVQLKRRHCLIPNLLSTVKGYAQFERDVLEDVTRLRTQLLGDTSVADKQRDENALSAALKQLFAVVENYPDLKANQNFLELQQELVEIEDTIQKARRYYNATVRDYNIRVGSFPSLLVAQLFAFRTADFFELATSTEREVPHVAVDDSPNE